MLNITRVEIRLHPRTAAPLGILAYATIELGDCFVIHDMKIIRGKKGVFLCMPSRRVSDYCPSCQKKVGLEDHFCAACGLQLKLLLNYCPDCDRKTNETVCAECGQLTQTRDFFKDICHPVSRECRDDMERQVLEAFRLEETRQP